MAMGRPIGKGKNTSKSLGDRRGGHRPGIITRTQNRADDYFVYIVVEDGETAFCKVGITNDPTKRLRGLQQGNARKLCLASTVFAGDVFSAARAEEHIYRALKDRKMQGEWFRVDPADALDLVNKIIVPGVAIVQQQPSLI